MVWDTGRSEVIPPSASLWLCPNQAAVEHGAAVHVDGALGLFARLLPEAAERLAGLEGVDTVAGDAHKWLNVPYDSGFIFTRHFARQVEFFQSQAAYLPHPPQILATRCTSVRRTRIGCGLYYLGHANGLRPRRAPVGRAAVRRTGATLGGRLDREPCFEVCAAVRLNVVCFRPRGVHGKRWRLRRSKPTWSACCMVVMSV